MLSADALKQRSLVVLGMSTDEPVEEEAGAKAGGAREAASERVTSRQPATKERQESENAPRGGAACGADAGGCSSSRVAYEERGSEAASGMHSLEEEEEEVRSPASKTTEEAQRVRPGTPPTPLTPPEPSHQPLYACKSCRYRTTKGCGGGDILRKKTTNLGEDRWHIGCVLLLRLRP